MKEPIELRINGENVIVFVDGNLTLLEFLREQLGLTGVKRGCDQGDCGACTVLLDGQPVNSCLALVSEAAGKEITTIEGLSKDGKLHPLQQAFVDYNAVQCGFCTPGMILTAVALLNENPTQPLKRSANTYGGISAVVPVTTRSSTRFKRRPLVLHVRRMSRESPRK